MKCLIPLFFASLLCELASATEVPPTWAYAQNPANNLVQPVEETIRHVPNSNVTYTFGQVKDLFFSPDWHPQNHAPPTRGSCAWP